MFRAMSEPAPDTDSIYLAAYGSSVIDEETLRAIGISLLGVDRDARVAATYRPRAHGNEMAWKIWLEGTFNVRLGARFCAAYHAVAAMRLDELFAIDAEIDRLLNREERAGSLEASGAFLDGKNDARQLPQWSRLVFAIEKGETPGHLATVFATQCVIFGLPLLSSLVAFSFYEWHLGECSVGGDPSRLQLRHFQECHPQTFHSVQRVFSEARDDNGGSFRLASL